MSDMRLIVAGAGGRMGRTLIRAIADARGVTLSGALEEPGSPLLGRNASDLAGVGGQDIIITDDAETLFADADGIIDFTIPKATVALAKLAAKAGIVHVIGTTGFSSEDDAAIADAAKKAVIVKSGNMSLGVNLLAALVERAAKALPDYDIEILEMHHKMKVDAPSGTALLLGAAAARGRDVSLQKNSVRGRDGETGPRNDGAIGFASLRGGTVVGEHQVFLAGPGERIVLSHSAEDRSIFARGALAAAKWGQGKKPGLYGMTDVLGL